MSQYRPLGLVGQGQYGQVYLAYSPAIRGLVALKALHPQRFPTRNFLRELRFLLALNHPQIVRCYTLDYWQGKRCLVMDYGEAGTLRSLLEQEDHLPLVLALELTAEILAGLQYIHERGIIHCDIKPENILLRLTRESWTAQISDLGVARIEAEVESAGHTGSPAYMAPERFYGQYLPASDLYAVGVLLFEMITGDRPFHGTPVQLMSAHLSHAPEISPGLPFLVQTLLKKSLTKLPQKRYQSAVEMAQAVKLAHDVLLAEGQQFYPLFPKSCSWYQAWQATTTYSLSQPLTELIRCGDDAVGLVLGMRVQFFRDGRPVEIAQSQGLVKKLYPGTAGYWYLNAEGRVYDSDQEPPLLTLETMAHPPLLGIEATGRWIAQAPMDLTSPLLIRELLSGRIFKGELPIAKPEAAQLKQLVAITPRYGLALIELIKTEQTMLSLFNRRGRALLHTKLPFRLTQLTQAQKSPWKFIALSPDQPQAVILIRLKPWQIQRIILSFSPQWVIATPWGYAVANHTTAACIAETGELLGGIGLKTPLTAITASGDSGLWLATWDGKSGQLERVEFADMGLDLIL